MANIVKELRKKSSEELAELIVKCKEQLLQIRFSVANGESEKLHNKAEIKKTIAQSLTILNERSIQAQQKAKKEASTTPTSNKTPKKTTTTKKSVAKKGASK